MGGLTTNSQAGPSRGTRSRRKKSNLKAPPADHRQQQDPRQAQDERLVYCGSHGWAMDRCPRCPTCPTCEDVMWMAATGETPQGIARRLGDRPWKDLYRHLDRHGALPLWRTND